MREKQNYVDITKCVRRCSNFKCFCDLNRKKAKIRRRLLFQKILETTLKVNSSKRVELTKIIDEMENVTNHFSSELGDYRNKIKFAPLQNIIKNN